jgi:hypothetical protein
MAGRELGFLVISWARRKPQVQKCFELNRQLKEKCKHTTNIHMSMNTWCLMVQSHQILDIILRPEKLNQYFL